MIKNRRDSTRYTSGPKWVSVLGPNDIDDDKWEWIDDWQGINEVDEEKPLLVTL
jgi:hypothetical protein